MPTLGERTLFQGSGSQVETRRTPAPQGPPAPGPHEAGCEKRAATHVSAQPCAGPENRTDHGSVLVPEHHVPYSKRLVSVFASALFRRLSCPCLPCSGVVIFSTRMIAALAQRWPRVAAYCGAERWKYFHSSILFGFFLTTAHFGKMYLKINRLAVSFPEAVISSYENR